MWLSPIREFRPPVDKFQRVWIRHGSVRSGLVVPTPEFHPCCECSVILSGRATVNLGAERIEREAGDVFLVSPGLPHDHRILKYPLRYCAVFFDPLLLLEISPGAAGSLLLQRFLGRQSFASRLLKPPPGLRASVVAGFGEMIDEAGRNPFGWEIRIAAILLDLLVRLRRWEIESGKEVACAGYDANWKVVCKTLAYLREHYAEEIYAGQLARAVGVSSSRLRAFFQDLLGMTWGQCLNLLRLEQAQVMLHRSQSTVAEIALACGFQTLSHFNREFSGRMDMSPSDYRRRIVRNGTTGLKAVQAVPTP